LAKLAGGLVGVHHSFFLINFDGDAAYLAYRVQKSGRKTATFKQI